MGVGAFFSNMVMFFIILTTAITLNRHGMVHIETSRQAAEALRPFAGNFAATLFTLGIVGVGFLAIPTLAGSTAYAFAETLGWRQGLNKKLRQARWFYGLILFATGVGVGLDFIGINPVRALYWTAAINGLLGATSRKGNLRALKRSPLSKALINQRIRIWMAPLVARV